ncbi:hypothetical protein GGS23DRAFT_508356 [Durotheca rogersii]|uniref:uncharacterized protein n=1 Tax=Durotheca rogersii TaxID=419775 RepID=UPI00221F937B|nr:uncharacterized protein GGS23DRAFT_508356 [Durotheca rogersii]KAI5863647.1 hypothetical protein GGS23DRAFT_508356 [Durotheca rogersii]
MVRDTLALALSFLRLCLLRVPRQGSKRDRNLRSANMGRDHPEFDSYAPPIPCLVLEDGPYQGSSTTTAWPVGSAFEYLRGQGSRRCVRRHWANIIRRSRPGSASHRDPEGLIVNVGRYIRPELGSQFHPVGGRSARDGYHFARLCSLGDCVGAAPDTHTPDSSSATPLGGIVDIRESSIYSLLICFPAMSPQALCRRLLSPSSRRLASEKLPARISKLSSGGHACPASNPA